MIYWVPFLHFYQPPTQFHAVLKKVCNESYRPLLKMLIEHPAAKVTINICAVLTEMLNDHGASDVIKDIERLARNGQLEFVDSAKYHAILPLMPPKEIQRQIELNHKTNTYFFKDAYRVSGFFPPEMCISHQLADVLIKMEYEWFLAGGIACPEKWPLDKIYKFPVAKSEINVFYRDDILSNKISFHNIDSAGFISELINLSRGYKDIYVITAMDAETFGHHIQNWESLFLAELYEMIDGVSNHVEIKQKTDLAAHHREILELGEKAEIKVLTISEILDKFPKVLSKQPRPSSWSTTKEDISHKNYYPLWKGINNSVHNLQWQHIKICFELVEQASKIKGNNEETSRFYNIARGLIDRAVHSCQFWWANGHSMWDINLINKGLMFQEEVILNAFKAINISHIKEEKKEQSYHKVSAARDIANKIRDALFG